MVQKHVQYFQSFFLVQSCEPESVPLALDYCPGAVAEPSSTGYAAPSPGFCCERAPCLGPFTAVVPTQLSATT
eukprot:2276542-Amphidinium_carterae.1